METRYIWSRDKLRALLAHPSDEVQSWAACRVLELYPDTKDEMLACLLDASPTVAFHLLDAFQDMALPDTATEPLCRFIQGERSPGDKAVAALLLARLGHELPDEDMKALPWWQIADDLALADAGFSFLLRQIYQRPSEEKADDLLYALACGCGAGDLYNLLSHAKSMSERSRAEKKRLKSFLSSVLDVKDTSTALKLLEESVQKNAPVLSPQPGCFPSLTAKLGENSKRCTLLAERIRELPELYHRSASRELDLLVACTLSQLRDGGYLNSLAGASLDVPRLWEILTTRWWTPGQVDTQVVEMLSKQPAEHVVHTLEEALGRIGFVYTEYAFQCLEAAEVPGRYDLLLDALEGRWSINVAEDAEAVIRRTKLQILETALARWKNKLPSASNIMWLETCPTEDVLRFLSDNFESYMTTPDSRWFIETLGEVGSPDFLERLLADWRPGETIIGSAMKNIVAINGIHNERIAPVVEDVRKREDEFNSAVGADQPAAPPKALTPLRCTACGRTYHYEMRSLYIEDKKRDVIIGDIIQCKGCGSIETYERTAETLMSLNAQLILVTAMAKNKKMPDADLPIKGVLKAVTAAGREFKTTSDAYRFLAAAVERDPDNPDLLKRLANLLVNGNRPDIALPRYLKALHFNPGDAEITYSVTRILLDQGKYHEAIPYVEKLPRLIREGTIDNKLRRDLFSAMLGQTLEIFEKTGHRISLWPRDEIEQAIMNVSAGTKSVTFDLDTLDLSDPDEFEQAYRMFLGGGRPAVVLDQPEQVEPFRAGPKVDRNDPCPCGSGKKYKKCCGR